MSDNARIMQTEAMHHYTSRIDGFGYGVYCGFPMDFSFAVLAVVKIVTNPLQSGHAAG